MKMNHDYAHCFEYDKKKCSAKCFRAQLTRELLENMKGVDFLVSWAHFKGTQYCALEGKDEKAKN